MTTEKHAGLSTLGEDEEQSTIDRTSANLIQDQAEDFEAIEELEDFSPNVKIEANKFRMLCENVQTSLADIDNAMLELVELKDNLLLQFLPANVLGRISLVVSRVYRAYSISQIPINELVRLAQLYSQPFDMKSYVLKKLVENNETKKRMLNVALQRLTSMETRIRQHQLARCVNNWEKMYIELALPRSNVRKWKFRLKTFRETSQLGYEHVIAWLNMHSLRPPSVSDTLSADEPANQDDEHGDGERFETSGDIVSVPELDEQGGRLEQASDFADELESDNEGSFLSSAGKQRTKRQGESEAGKGLPTIQQSGLVTKTDAEIQAKVISEDQYTSTGDVLSTKSLIIRIYRPVGLIKTKFQCIITARKQRFTTQVFIVEKMSSAKDETSKNKARAPNTRTGKGTDSKTKKRGTESATPEETDLNTIDKQQNDEILVPMPSFFKRRSLLETDRDPDGIQIDVMGDDQLCGSVVLSPEDLRLLDLPNLNSPTSAPLIVIDESVSQVSASSSKADRYEFDQASIELYKAWTSRMPPTFAIYNEKNESIGKLPLQMFWFNKVEITHAVKCTMTAPMEVRSATPEKVIVTQMPTPVETQERGISPILMSTNMSVDSSTQPSLSRLENVEEHIETLKISYEDRIAKLHDSYQAEIRRLTKLLNETPSRRSSQIGDLSETDEAANGGAEQMENPNLRRTTKRATKRDIHVDHQPTPVYGKDLPKKFLDRYQMFLEKSLAHRHQLVTKVEQETARNNERQMEIQHRLHRADPNDERYDDLCLPAVFMPFRSGNVFNPRAYRYFHSIGNNEQRLTQTPSVFKLPPLPSGSVSVLNLFELSRIYDGANEREQNSAEKATSQPPAPPTTQTSN